MNIQANISNSLKVYRKLNELSQESLAEKLGVTSQAVSKWECMQSIPDIETVVAIAEMLGISTDKLLLGHDFASGEPVDAHDSPVDSDAGHMSAEEQREIQFNGSVLRYEDGPDGLSIVIKVHVPHSADGAGKKQCFHNILNTGR